MSEELITVTDSDAGLGFLRLTTESGRSLEVPSPSPDHVADHIHHFRQLTEEK